MTKRAERLAKYLEDELGWGVYGQESRYCKNGHVSINRCEKYCTDCGGKLPAFNKKTDPAIAELEQAIKYALKKD